MVVLAVLAYLVQHYKDDEKLCNELTIAGFVFVMFFVGLRGFAMFDWRNYYPEFQNVTAGDIDLFAVGEDREIGWTTFMVLCKSVYDNYHFMVFIQCCILFTLLFRFFKHYSDNIFLTCALCFAFDGFAMTFNLLRNGLAIAIFLNALPYLVERKPLQYYLLCLAAFCFHYSSVFFFPLYFFLHLKLNKYIFLGYLLFCAGFYLANVPVFATLAEMFFGGSEMVTKAVEVYTKMSHEIKISPIFLERVMTGVLIFCYYDKLHTMRKETSIFINAYLLYISCCFLISDLSEISARLSTLFVFSYWILYGDIFRCFAIPNNRRLFMSFIALYCLYRTAMPMGNIVYKYDNLLFGIESFNQRAMIFDRSDFDK